MPILRIRDHLYKLLSIRSINTPTNIKIPFDYYIKRLSKRKKVQVKIPWKEMKTVGFSCMHMESTNPGRRPGCELVDTGGRWASGNDVSHCHRYQEHCPQKTLHVNCEFSATTSIREVTFCFEKLITHKGLSFQG